MTHPPDHHASQADKAFGSISDACAYSGLCPTFIKERVRDRDIPARKAGGRTIIVWPGFLKWLDGLPPAGKPQRGESRPAEEPQE